MKIECCNSVPGGKAICVELGILYLVSRKMNPKEHLYDSILFTHEKV